MSEPYRTKTGRILTDEDVQALADEAERGYDPANFTERVPPRRWRCTKRFTLISGGLDDSARMALFGLGFGRDPDGVYTYTCLLGAERATDALFVSRYIMDALLSPYGVEVLVEDSECVVV
jgi:hypothetical protein